jgi:hypothetical protein
MTYFLFILTKVYNYFKLLLAGKKLISLFIDEKQNAHSVEIHLSILSVIRHVY